MKNIRDVGHSDLKAVGVEKIFKIEFGVKREHLG